MFVSDEIQLDVSFAIARERLTQLAEGGALLGTSEEAYDHGTGGVARVQAAGLSKLVRVQVRELSGTDGSAGLAIRWEAAGPGAGLFPVLDADVQLAPAGGQATVLTIAGVYRPSLDAMGEAPDRAILHRVAVATIRSFLTGVAAVITGQPPDHGAFQGGPGSRPRPVVTRR